MKIKNIFIWLIFSFFFFPFTIIAAGSATLSYGGNNSVYVGNNITVQVKVSNIMGSPLAAIGTKIVFDKNYLEYVSSSGATSPYEFFINENNFKIAGYKSNPSAKNISSNQTIYTFTFKALKVGNTTLSFSDSDISDSNSVSVNVQNVSKTITISEPPSGNNNLSSLSISNGTINFNKNTTSYEVNVDENVTSLNIDAKAEDGGASVSGTGNKTLKYGSNKFEIVVKAANGDKKTYTVYVNRKDNRSSNNNLSSLKLSSGNIDFNSNKTEYNVSVPFSVNKINVTAVAADNKAKVEINSPELIAEEVTNISVKVTAENGSSKTYVIRATREKDPNKELSKDNNLSNLIINNGTLEPSFDKNEINYTVIVPFNINKIEFEPVVSDTKYATYKIEGNDRLNIGNNKYSIIVTAEDGSTKTYNVVVTRQQDPNYISTSIYLKELNLTNGTLDKNFDKSISVYKYKKGKDFKIEAVPEDEYSRVTVLEREEIITIFVEAGNGDSNVYVLIPKTDNYILYIAIGVLTILIGIGTFMGYRHGLNKNSK